MTEILFESIPSLNSTNILKTFKFNLPPAGKNYQLLFTKINFLIALYIFVG